MLQNVLHAHYYHWVLRPSLLDSNFFDAITGKGQNVTIFGK